MLFKKKKTEIDQEAKSSEAKSKASKKKTVIFYSLASVFTVCLGIGAGVLAHHFLGETKATDYANVNGDKLMDDPSIARSKFEQAKKKGTAYEETLKPYEMVNVALEQYSALPSTKTVGLGAAEAMKVNQVIQSIQIKNGDRYFEESNSTSAFVNLYDRMYQEGDTTTTYWGDDLNYASHEKKEYSNADYAAMMGRNVSDAMIYVISSKTSTSNESNVKSPYGPSRITKESGGYTVDLELHPINAVVNYVCQMQNISGLDGKPSFIYCHLTFHLDADLMPLDYTSYEQYTAKKTGIPITTTITGSLTTYFYQGETYEIPTLQSETQSEYKAIEK